MTSYAVTKPHWSADLMTLVKPRITMMSVMSAAVGLLVAPGSTSLIAALSLLAGVAIIVGSANTLNMYIERESDAHMARTRNRPLPDRRMAPAIALIFGVAQGAAALPLLYFGAGPLPALLGAIALFGYVCVYTPLKRVTPLATLIGAVPGAMPPLMGWTAITGELDIAGVLLFSLMFLWQMPHFHAISLFRHEEYTNAGLKILPDTRGVYGTRVTLFLYLIAQVAVSVALYPWVGGKIYLAVAVVTGLAYLVYGARGLRRDVDSQWARNFFFASIVYLPAVFVALLVDGVG